MAGFVSMGRRNARYGDFADHHARDGRVGDRGHRPRVARIRWRFRQRGRHHRRGLDRQGRRRGPGARQRHDHRPPGRGRRRSPGRLADGGDGVRRRGRPRAPRRTRSQGRGDAGADRQRLLRQRRRRRDQRQPTSRPRRSRAGWPRPRGRPLRRHAHRARRQGHQGGRAQRRATATAPRRPPTAGEEKALRGPAAMLAKAMDESRAVPTATSFRTIAVDTLDAKRKAINAQLKERGLKTSFTHLVAWAIVEATGDDAGDGPHLRRARRQAVRDRERPGQPRRRRRRDQKRRLAQPDGPGDQGLPGPRLRRASTRPSKT